MCQSIYCLIDSWVDLEKVLRWFLLFGKHFNNVIHIGNTQVVLHRAVWHVAVCFCSLVTCLNVGLTICSELIFAIFSEVSIGHSTQPFAWIVELHVLQCAATLRLVPVLHGPAGWLGVCLGQCHAVCWVGVRVTADAMVAQHFSGGCTFYVMQGDGIHRSMQTHLRTWTTEFRLALETLDAIRSTLQT